VNFTQQQMPSLIPIFSKLIEILEMALFENVIAEVFV
jgi:hypothetical protein